MSGEDSGPRRASEHFKIALAIVVGMTILMLGVSIWLSVGFSDPTAAVTNLDTFTEAAMMAGIGALTGLPLGRAMS